MGSWWFSIGHHCRIWSTNVTWPFSKRHLSNFKGDRSFVLFSKSNKPLFRTRPRVKAQKSCVARVRFYRVSVGTRWRPKGFCPMPIVSSMQITTILQFIVHNVLSMHNPPMLLVPSMHIAKYTIHVFLRNCKIVTLIQYSMQYLPCNSALLAQEILFLTQKGTFFAQRSPKSA